MDRAYQNNNDPSRILYADITGTQPFCAASITHIHSMAHLAVDSLQSSAPNVMTNFEAPLTIESCVTLNSGEHHFVVGNRSPKSHDQSYGRLLGHRMPILGFGTWKLEKAEEACSEAIKIGYRHLDSARIYRTEADVSNAVQKR
jgi:hypothetical protein